MATRSLSATLTLAVGSTLATMILSPTFISSRISEPSCSTTSITASKHGWSRSAGAATGRASGGTPSVPPRAVMPAGARAERALAADMAAQALRGLVRQLDAQAGVLGDQRSIRLGHRNGGEIHCRGADETGDELISRLIV